MTINSDEMAWQKEQYDLEQEITRLRDAIARASAVEFAGSCCGCAYDDGFTEVKNILAATEPTE